MDDKVWALRLKGLSLRAIGCELGMSHEAARLAVKRHAEKLAMSTQDMVMQWRELQLERLETSLKAIWDRVEQGDLKAIERALSIIESSRKMLGVDAPQRAEHKITTGKTSVDDYTDQELIEIIERGKNAETSNDESPYTENGGVLPAEEVSKKP